MLTSLDSKRSRSTISLRWVLIISFVVPIVGAVWLVGYLSYRSSQAAVGNLANHLMVQTSIRIDKNLRNYLRTPANINRNNAAALNLGILDSRDLTTAKQYFWQQSYIYEDVTAIGMITEKKEFLVIRKQDNGSRIIRLSDQSTDFNLKNYLADSRGNPIKLMGQINNFDPHHDPPSNPYYRNTKIAGDSTWQITASVIEKTPFLVAVNFLPFYDRSNTFQGIVTSAVSLTQVGTFLKSLNMGPNGQAVVLERTGQMIGTSTGEMPFQPKNDNDWKKAVETAPRRLSILDSHNLVTQKAAQTLIDRFGSLDRIQDRQQFKVQIKGQRYLVLIEPLNSGQDLDWLMLIVIPESDFMAELQANTFWTILLSGLTLAAAIGISVFTARWISRPMLQLSLASQALARGKSQEPLSEDLAITEIKTLATSFNQMSVQLSQSFDRVEVALQESKEKYKTLFQTLPIGVMMTDAQGKIIEANLASERILGISNQAQMARTYDDPEWQTIRLDGSPMPAIEYPAVQALTHNCSINGVELGIVQPDSSIRWLSVSAAPIALAQYGVAIAYIDISKRKRAESDRLIAEVALRNSEERFRRAFDDAAIGMALVTTEGQFMGVNRSLCDMLGYSEAQLLTKRFEDITYADDLDSDLNYMHQVLSGERRSYQVEKRYVHKQGHIVWTVLCVSMVIDLNGTPLYFVSQIQDISERHEIDRMKDEFISVVSHELRTPLTAIRGSLGILETGVLENQPEKAKYMLQIAINSSDRLVRLVNDILELERLESGSVEMVMESCQIADLMQQAVDAVQAIASQASMTLCPTPLSAEIWAAPDAIVQVLINLLSNAIKFSPSGSTVWLSAASVSHPCPHILFSIKDQGCGIPADRLETIFGRFQQVDVSDSRQKGGTGLGLAICKSIVQQHDGQIWLESIREQGSTFYFTIPMPKAEPCQKQNHDKMPPIAILNQL